MRARACSLAAALALCAAHGALAADDADALAKKLANPVAAMISVPFQFNADFGGGPDGGVESYNLKAQAVIPFHLSSEWNVISRTIVPLAGVSGLPGGDVWGLSDTTQSFYLSPSTPNPNGIVWGIGPSFLIPTATDEAIGSGKWGAGPTGLILRQSGPLSVGILATQTWSFAGDADRPDVNTTFLQPFMSYALGGGRTVSLNSETTYDWTAGQWTVPINLSFSKVFHVNNQAMSWMVGGRVYVAKPDGGPDWGVRAGLTFLFPEK
jgi:hypothetical protein